MAHWRDFEEASPDLAAKAQELLKHEGGNLNFAFLATQSSSGRLRLHPVPEVD